MEEGKKNKELLFSIQPGYIVSRGKGPLCTNSSAGIHRACQYNACRKGSLASKGHARDPAELTHALTFGSFS